MHKISLFLFSFCLVQSFAIAQTTPTPTIVTGSVRDAHNQEPLPFVNVFFVGTTIGVVADMEGNYRIETTEDVDSIAFSFLGYEEKFFVLDKGQTQSFDIRLAPKQNYLETATVQGGKRKKLPKDTAALELWEEVIAHKHIHEKPRVDNIHYTDYTKVEFDLYSPRKIKKIPMLPRGLRFVLNYAQTQGIDDHYLPLMMKETITEIYKRTEPKAKKHIIKADRLSGIDNEDVSNFVSAEFDEINPYANVITLADKSFIGPFATTGTVSYRYFLTDSLVKNGEMYYRLDFWGRSKQDLTFGGSAWIHKRTYGIEKIEMELSPHANINFIQNYRIQQRYRLVEDSVWLQEYEKAQALVTVLKRKKKNPISLWIRKHTNHANLEWNIQLPDSIFAGEPVKKDREAYKRPEVYWDSLRPDTLNRIERNIYTMVDSIKNSKTFKQMYWMGYFVTSSYMRAKYIEFGRVFEMVSWNEVEGVRLKLGTRTTNVLSKRFSANAYVAYGTKDKLWKTSLGFSWNIPSKSNKWQNLRASYRNDYTMMGSINRLLTYDNIFVSMTRNSPLSKLMRVQSAEVSYGRAWTRGLDNTLSLRHKIFYSTPENGFDLSGGASVRNTFSVSEAQLSTHWGPGELFLNGVNNRQTLGSKLPVFYLDYTFRYMSKFINNQDIVNHKLDFQIRHRLHWQLGLTKYNLQFSKTWGPAPYPVMTIHTGNQNWLYNKYAFNLMRDFEFASDMFASLTFDHFFEGFFLNKIPLIKKLGFREIFSAKLLYGTMSAKNAALMPLPQGTTAPGFYAEIGFGIENILKLFRVDFVWRMTQLDKPSTVPFGVKFAIQPKF